MARFFTLAQAIQALPQVRELIAEALTLKREFDNSDKELKQATQNIRLMGGARVNPGRMLDLRAARDHAVTRLQTIIEQVHETGAQVKDLDMGLIDFPSLYRGEEVCLCWRSGESSIEYWHGASEGFQGRKPIDQEFLDNHRGDRFS